jgi:hypothetical protein
MERLWLSATKYPGICGAEVARKHILIKLNQVTFFLQKMEEARSVDDQFAVECYFAAYLSSLRSIVFYVETWMKKSGKTRTKREWLRKIRRWEKHKLAPDQRQEWRCVTRLRNKDVHEEPIIPDTRGGGGYWHRTYWPKGYWAKGYWLNLKEFTITDTSQPSNPVYDIFDVCQTGIDVATKLLKDYTTLT